MITISLQSIYYAFGIVSILCGAAYKLGYEIGKNTKKQLFRFSGDKQLLLYNK